MADEIPQWAIERATAIRADAVADDLNWTETLARFVAAHEDPPVDPLLIEAREVVARHWETSGSPIEARLTRKGERDRTGMMGRVVEGVRRGMEIAKTIDGPALENGNV